MWYAGIVICNLIMGQCGVLGLTPQGKTSFEAKAQCQEAVESSMTKISKLDIDRVRSALKDNSITISGGCLSRPADWERNSYDFKYWFGPYPRKKEVL
jgi:hypothetical protein